MYLTLDRTKRQKDRGNVKTRNDKNGSTDILHIEGRIDATSSPELEKQILEVSEVGSGAVLLDFSGVDYVSSAGLRVLLVGVKSLSGSARNLVVAGARDDVMDVIQLTGFHRILTIYGSLESALEGIGTRN